MTAGAPYSAEQKRQQQPRLFDLARYLDLPPHARLLAMVLIGAANKTGISKMSLARLTDETGMQISTIRKHRELLVKKGILEPMKSLPSGIKQFRVIRSALLTCQISSSRWIKNAPARGSEIDPQNPEMKIYNQSSVATAQSTPSEKTYENGSSEAFRSIIAKVFPKAPNLELAAFIFDPPGLRIYVTDQKMHEWFSRHETKLVGLGRQLGLEVTWCNIEFTSGFVR